MSLAGFVMGGVLAAFLAVKAEDPPAVLLLVLLSLPPACAAAVYFGSLWIVDRAGRLASTIYNPSGDGTPHLPEFSYADSLAARGRWEEAVRVLLEAAEERGGDPRPLVRAARILRDDLGRAEEAASLFRRARRERELDRAMEMLVTREIAEIHLHRLDRPLGAAPELARLVERFPETPGAAWAEETLARMRRTLRTETAGTDEPADPR